MTTRIREAFPGEHDAAVVPPAAPASLERAEMRSVKATDMPRTLAVFKLSELLDMQIPTREYVLSPILPEKGLAMVHSWRGVGKTHVVLGIGFAIATGTPFLRWNAPKPRKVLLIDGEMPLITLQERLRYIRAAAGIEEAEGYFNIIAADAQNRSLPDLASEEGQRLLAPYVDEADVILLDNLATLCRSERKNDEESWMPVQGWLLSLRRAGKAVVFVHHDGKGKAQRGTSSKEDILDTVIHLTSPEDYSPIDGAHFEVNFTKARGFTGKDATPFEAKLEVIDGRATWSIDDLEGSRDEIIAALKDGMTIRAAAKEFGLSRSAIGRIKMDAKVKGR
jgi:putative DNA primase/helicase